MILNPTYRYRVYDMASNTEIRSMDGVTLREVYDNLEELSEDADLSKHIVQDTETDEMETLEDLKRTIENGIAVDSISDIRHII